MLRPGQAESRYKIKNLCPIYSGVGHSFFAAFLFQNPAGIQPS